MDRTLDLKKINEMDKTLKFLREITEIVDGELNWDNNLLSDYDYETNRGYAELECSLIEAYELYKTMQDRFDFNYVANDKELTELGEYIDFYSNKSFGLDKLYEIDRKMAIVGCRNFLTNENIRNIIEMAIEHQKKFGLYNAIYFKLDKLLKQRKEEIPSVLIDAFHKEQGIIAPVNKFYETLDKITSQETDDIIVQNGKIYKFVGNI